MSLFPPRDRLGYAAADLKAAGEPMTFDHAASSADSRTGFPD
jgi:hypothetical protein